MEEHKWNTNNQYNQMERAVNSISDKRHPFIVYDDIGKKEIPVNGKITTRIESDVFIGDCVMKIAGVADADVEYFKGKKRRSQTIIQGRFKYPVKVSKVSSGYRFEKKFVNVPAVWLFEKAFSIVKMISPLLDADPFGDQPYFFAPLMHVAQTLRVDFPEDAPSILCDEALIENTKLFGKAFSNDDKCKSVSYRRKYVERHPEEMENIYFEPQYVYTFQFYEHMLDIASFSIDFGFGLRASLPKYLQGQPIHILVTVNADESDLDLSSGKGKRDDRAKQIDAWKLDIIHDLNKSKTSDIAASVASSATSDSDE